MAQKNLESAIADALFEARILEDARETFDEDHMLLIAMRLSDAPFSFVKHVYDKQKLVAA